MKLLTLIGLILTGLLGACRVDSESNETSASTAVSKPPNIIVLFADDAGYADFSFNGNELIKTPNIDAIAERGVTFSQGYVSAAVCSPSRAGLLTGRYQQRFGHEYNLGGNYSETKPELMGLPVSEKTIADLLGVQGYYCGMIGKWHLGTASHFHPMRRGFHEFFGLLGGGSSYLPGQAKRIRRNHQAAEFQSLPYLTDAFGDEAVRFIERLQAKPFFLFLSFNAPHTPLHARPDYLAEARPHFESEARAINAAMTRSLDENIGKVMKTLRDLGLEEDTLVFFSNDNGGAMPYNASSNAPFSGTKGTFLEGGVHVPFLAQWPARLSAGSRFEHPVSTLDILPTALAAAGGHLPQDRLYDGEDLMPFLSGARSQAPHETLMWRLSFHGAIRKGDWKLLWFRDHPPRLHRLSDDPAEQRDLSQQHPKILRELLRDFHAWEEGLAAPLWRTHPRWEKHSLKRYDQSFVETLRRR